MKPCDHVGNPLVKDDMVVICDGDARLIGIVQEITESHLITPGTQADPRGRVAGVSMPGMVTIVLLPYNIAYDSQKPTRLPNIFKLVKPPQLDLGKTVQ